MVAHHRPWHSSPAGGEWATTQVPPIEPIGNREETCSLPLAHLGPGTPSLSINLPSPLLLDTYVQRLAVSLPDI
jgi:hypothetical protein